MLRSMDHTIGLQSTQSFGSRFMGTLMHASVTNEFHVDQQLLDKCIPLFQGQEISYLLHRNAHVIWIILVPHTSAEEFYQLPPEQLQLLCAEINRISINIENCFPCDQLHVTTIGNAIEKMHVHIICRDKNDRFLPEEMWDRPVEQVHSQNTITQLEKIIEDTAC